MRTLIDEYGHLIITLIIASIMLISATFNLVIPQMQEYTQEALSHSETESVIDYNAISQNIDRASPIITVNNAIVLKDELFDIKNYINEGNIKAINADGDNISNKIIIIPCNDISRKFYDTDTGVFNCSDLGEYKFIVSVKDATAAEYFGKDQREIFKITVNEPAPVPEETGAEAINPEGSF